MTRIRTVRNSKLSVFQSMVDDVIERVEGQRRTHRPTVDHPTVRAAAVAARFLHEGKPIPDEPPGEVTEVQGGSDVWECVKLSAELLRAKVEGDHARARQLEDELKDSVCDPEWAEAVTEYVEYFGIGGDKRKIPYVTYEAMDDFVLETLPRNATVALLADWGTQTPVAEALLREVAGHDPDVLLHLGDIYYAGTHKENRRFLERIDQVLPRSEGRVPVYTLSGNHDMYSGGVGYYGILPELNPAPGFRPDQAQPASFFCLRSPDGAWQLLAMDTGLHDHDPFEVQTAMTRLDPREAAWHRDKISSFEAGGGRTVLLSHHQLFSAFSRIGKDDEKPAGREAYNTNLLGDLAGELDKVDAWFWGHEHNLCVYRPYGELPRGRCIGHGAIPMFASQKPYETRPELSDPPRLVDGPDGGPLELPLNRDGVYTHGYVILRLDDDRRTATADYYLAGEPGSPFFTESF